MVIALDLALARDTAERGPDANPLPAHCPVPQPVTSPPSATSVTYAWLLRASWHFHSVTAFVPPCNPKFGGAASLLSNQAKESKELTACPWDTAKEAELLLRCGPARGRTARPGGLPAVPCSQGSSAAPAACAAGSAAVTTLMYLSIKLLLTQKLSFWQVKGHWQDYSHSGPLCCFQAAPPALREHAAPPEGTQPVKQTTRSPLRASCCSEPQHIFSAFQRWPDILGLQEGTAAFVSVTKTINFMACLWQRPCMVKATIHKPGWRHLFFPWKNKCWTSC